MRDSLPAYILVLMVYRCLVFADHTRLYNVYDSIPVRRFKGLDEASPDDTGRLKFPVYYITIVASLDSHVKRSFATITEDYATFPIHLVAE